nr:MAG TPA: hypothetical protein [Caudoviricetes sp.]
MKEYSFIALLQTRSGELRNSLQSSERKAGSVIDGLLMYCRKTRRFTTCSRLSCYHFMPFW